MNNNCDIDDLNLRADEIELGTVQRANYNETTFHTLHRITKLLLINLNRTYRIYIYNRYPLII